MMNTVEMVGRRNPRPDPGSDLGRQAGGEPAGVVRRRDRDHADCITVVAFDGLVETAARYLVSGRQIGVVGLLHQAEWHSDDDRRRERVEVVAATIEFLDAPTG